MSLRCRRAPSARHPLSRPQAELAKLRAERAKAAEREQKLGAILNTAQGKLSAYEKALARAEEASSARSPPTLTAA
jgi:uncharacterized protein involved in exopolysaccharide biosynthesis